MRKQGPMQDIKGLQIQGGDILHFTEGIYRNDVWVVVNDPEDGNRLILSRRINEEAKEYEYGPLDQSLRFDTFKGEVIGNVNDPRLSDPNYGRV